MAKRSPMRSVGLDFMETAPWKIVNTITINASPQDVYRVINDPTTYPSWYEEVSSSFSADC